MLTKISKKELKKSCTKNYMCHEKWKILLKNLKNL